MSILTNLSRKIFPIRLRAFVFSQFTVYFRNTNPRKYGKCGKHVDLNGPLYLDASKVFLDDYTRIQPGVRVISSNGLFHVKRYSAVGAGCVIVPGAHVPTVGMPQYLSTFHVNDKDGDIVVEEDCWIGAGAYLLSHCRIGRGAIVAASAVVTKEVPPYAVVAGAPARIVATRFSLKQILRHEAILYPPEERMKKEVLEELFKTYYEGKKHTGADELVGDKALRLDMVKAQNGIPVYE